MNNQNNLSASKFIEITNLPADLFLGLTNISLLGNETLYLSNHKGILSFSEEEIVILSKKYQVQVKGKQLNIFSYSKDELVIKGNISSIGFI